MQAANMDIYMNVNMLHVSIDIWGLVSYCKNVSLFYVVFNFNVKLSVYPTSIYTVYTLCMLRAKGIADYIHFIFLCKYLSIIKTALKTLQSQL